MNDEGPGAKRRRRAFRWLAALACALLAAVTFRAAHVAAAESGGWQSRLAAELATVHRVVERYRDPAIAREEGWKKFGDDVPAMGEHWNHKAHAPQQAGEPLDLSRPLNLMYTKIDGRRRLVGVTYGYRLGPGDPLPGGFSGPLDIWHVHDFGRIVESAGKDRPLIRWMGRKWVDNRFAPDGRTRLAMVHVWLDGANPDGPFADRHRPLAYLRAGLGPEAWRNGSLEAAYGVALSHKDGCGNMLKAKLWMGGVRRRERRQIFRLCEEAAGQIRSSLGEPSARLDAIATLLWTDFDRRARALLTSEQLQRINALVEYPPGRYVRSALCGPTG